jgi:hypothetical protein
MGRVEFEQPSGELADRILARAIEKGLRETAFGRRSISQRVAIPTRFARLDPNRRSAQTTGRSWFFLRLLKAWMPGGAKPASREGLSEVKRGTPPLPQRAMQRNRNVERPAGMNA